MLQSIPHVAEDVINWLLEGDPTIRFQTHRDLIESSIDDIEHERMFIEIGNGWALHFLELQDDDGRWGGDLVDPEWKATLWTLNLLREFGINYQLPHVKKPTLELLTEGIQSDGGINYFADVKESEVCLSALVLANLCYFRVQWPMRDSIFEFFIESQLDDGGWNCKWKKGATHSSFHSTFAVLTALEEFLKINKKHEALARDLQQQGNEFLLHHKLYKSHNTGKVVNLEMTESVYPTFWIYNVLVALDYFQRINYPYDERFEDAIDLIENKKNDGKWVLEGKMGGETWFDFEVEGQNSRWVTLISLRVLKWWRKISKYKHKR